jgi:outer membrane lipoprotein SlyB
MNIYEMPAVTALVWLLCEGLKATKLPSRWLPCIAAVTGAVLGAVWCAVVGGSFPDAIVGGMAGGLAATGANEAVRLLFRGKE